MEEIKYAVFPRYSYHRPTRWYRFSMTGGPFKDRPLETYHPEYGWMSSIFKNMRGLIDSRPSADTFGDTLYNVRFK